jgi:predicted nucleic acid-binding protein
MSGLVVDASVALKWVLREPDSHIAEALLQQPGLAAPEFLQLECANSLWVAARKRIITSDQAAFSFAKISAAPLEWHAIPALLAAAQGIAFEVDRTVYDCLYLALALSLDAQFITADTRFAAAAEAHPVYGARIRRLAP